MSVLETVCLLTIVLEAFSSLLLTRSMSLCLYLCPFSLPSLPFQSEKAQNLHHEHDVRAQDNSLLPVYYTVPTK